MKRTSAISLPKAQRGAALVIGLLLLLVLTVLAVSGMNSASTELAMAGNYQYRNDAFNAAEAGIETAMVNGGFNTSSMMVQAPFVGSVAGSPDSYTTTLKLALPTPGSAPLSFSSQLFTVWFFDIRSQGNSARNDTALNTQGTGRIAGTGGAGTGGGTVGCNPVGNCTLTP